jgi:hypothetical protein
MKTLPFQILLGLVCVFTINANANGALKKDSTIKIIHSIDGKVSEWPIDKFEKNGETGIFYCVDHDADNLYLALKIANPQTQMKLTTFGMTLYVDKKGKKKEGTGIEFPIKKEGQSGGGRPERAERPGAGNAGNNPAPMDVNALHDKIANSMMLLKTFGFDGQEDKTQIFFALQSGINIAFDWDETNNMYFEYAIPFTYLGNKAPLVGKAISFGWKIYGMPEPDVSNLSSSSTRVVGVPSGGGGGGRSGRGSGTIGAVPSTGGDNSIKVAEQNIWGKYTINF